MGRRGFFFNLGTFSSSETLTLMKNFENFLLSKDRKIDPDSIADLIENGFSEFYKKHEMFPVVGKNLNRSSEQIYLRIKDLYHRETRDRIPASQDQLILQRVKDLKELDVHRRFKVIGEEIGRYNVQVRTRHKLLTINCSRSSSEV